MNSASVNWLPNDKKAAVVISVDDIFPTDAAERAFDLLQQLQLRHPQCKLTLFTTADWRSADPFPNEPGGRLRTVPPGTYRLDHHPTFCERLRNWPAIELGLHGLHHMARGRRTIAEFDGASRQRCHSILTKAFEIFEAASLQFRGLCPPAWHASDELLAAMVELGMSYVASARDLETPVTGRATANGSGLRGVALFEPSVLPNGLMHIPTNYQATSTDVRALSIIENGGVLSIKAHMLSEMGTYKALDGVTAAYMDQLDALFTRLEDDYGGEIWWTTMGEIAG